MLKFRLSDTSPQALAFNSLYDYENLLGQLRSTFVLVSMQSVIKLVILKPSLIKI